MDNRREFLLKSICGCAALSLGTLCVSSCGDSSEPEPVPEPMPEVDPRDYTSVPYCNINCSNCPEVSTCIGCKGEVAPYACTLRECAVEKEVLTCAHCADYPTCANPMWSLQPNLRRYADTLRAYLEKNDYLPDD
jgi:hypothetical protein